MSRRVHLSPDRLEDRATPVSFGAAYGYTLPGNTRAVAASGTPPELLGFDAFPGSAGGVFVG
jgi:hypothetical protein